MPAQRLVMTWTGRVLGAGVAGMLLFSAVLKFLQPPEFMSMFVDKFGYPQRLGVPIGVTEALCALLYLFPRTAVLGAILITGYLGGAVATHVRVGDPFVSPAVLGALAWVGLYLRDARVRAIAPITQPAKPIAHPGAKPSAGPTA